MPLSPPVDRRPHHTRRVICLAFERHDGLWDIEGNMTDVKAYAFDPPVGHLEAGQPLHDMWLRLTIDDSFTIRAIEAQMDAVPRDVCPGARPVVQELVGLRIGKGWMNEVHERMGGALGCTHLRELLGPMATTAFQAIRPAMRLRGVPMPRPGRGSCYGWSEEADRAAFIQARLVRKAQAPR